MTHLYEICLKSIKLFFSTVALKQSQGDDHFEVEGVQVGRELQERKTMEKEHNARKYVMYLEYEQEDR